MILNLEDDNEIISICVNLHLQVGFRVESRNYKKKRGGVISAKNTYALRRLYLPLLKFIRYSGVAKIRCLIFFSSFEYIFLHDSVLRLKLNKSYRHAVYACRKSPLTLPGHRSFGIKTNFVLVDEVTIM